MTKIIDAHIHFQPLEGFDALALAAGHENSEAHLRRVYAEKNIVHAVVMGNRSLEEERHDYPSFLSYCVGLDRFVLEQTSLQAGVELVERHLRRSNCVGIKLYPGYYPKYIYDRDYFPYYELARQFGKPVAIHTGSTARGMGTLRYCHPMTVDDVATLFPQVQFVMCHFGNPFVTEAAAVMGKNDNVSADLSGMLEGLLDLAALLESQSGYLQHLRTWIQYMGDYDRLLYGTDWPLVNIQNYLDFTSAIIPERHLEKVLFHNANRVYDLGL